jgi:hypothetical protein
MLTFHAPIETSWWSNSTTKYIRNSPIKHWHHQCLTKQICCAGLETTHRNCMALRSDVSFCWDSPCSCFHAQLVSLMAISVLTYASPDTRVRGTYFCVRGGGEWTVLASTLHQAVDTNSINGHQSFFSSYRSMDYRNWPMFSDSQTSCVCFSVVCDQSSFVSFSMTCFSLFIRFPMLSSIISHTIDSALPLSISLSFFCHFEI